MSEPTIEQIAQWLKDALAEITCANGYQQDLDVSRPEDRFLDDEMISDLTTIIVQAESTKGEGTSVSHIQWLQGFEIYVYFLAAKNAAVSLDTRINRVAADIHKRLGAELAAPTAGRFMDQLASGLLFEGSSITIDPDLHATVLSVDITIRYEVLATNPYDN